MVHSLNHMTCHPFNHGSQNHTLSKQPEPLQFLAENCYHRQCHTVDNTKRCIDNTSVCKFSPTQCCRSSLQYPAKEAGTEKEPEKLISCVHLFFSRISRIASRTASSSSSLAILPASDTVLTTLQININASGTRIIGININGFAASLDSLPINVEEPTTFPTRYLESAG